MRAVEQDESLRTQKLRNISNLRNAPLASELRMASLGSLGSDN
jgi:hypothetical protein